MAIDIRGSRIVITGAGSGIGHAAAVHCAGRGGEVIAVDIDAGAAGATAEACRQLHGSAHAHTCDVADGEAVAALAARIEGEHGPVDVLVSNAGVGMAGPFLEGSIQDWQWLRGVNVDGVVHSCHAFGQAMAERRRGHLVNIASMAGYVPSASLATYCTSKAAVIMFSQCLRADLASRGVGVSAVCPGVIDTPIATNTRLVGSMAGKRGQVIRAFRHGHSPEAVAKAIVRAVEHDRELVPVGIEAGTARQLLRIAPGPVRGLVARLRLD
ncbi:MAG: SDR family NAD(P)-dependent oxidoreductase [Actinomycetota bacterium]|nr:SDR family NAD(P)-dependent oxidoreductase [Actinomycetota bacterium]